MDDTIREEVEREHKYQRRNIIFIVVIIAAVLIFSFLTSSGNAIVIAIENNILIVYGLEDYSLEIPVEDILEISYLEDLDRGEPAGGTDDGTFSYGVWENDTLGTYQLYAYTEVASCILVRTADEAYVFNSSSDDLTQFYYEAFEDLDD